MTVLQDSYERARELDVGRAVARAVEAMDRARPLCPDHRDKQVGKPCLACTIEALERWLSRAEGILDAIKQNLQADGLSVSQMRFKLQVIRDIVS